MDNSIFRNRKVILKVVLLQLAIGIFSEIRAQGVWTQKSNFGGNPRTEAAGFALGFKGYIGTGYDGLQLIRRKDFWEFDPMTNSWTQVADFGGTARSGAVAFTIGGKGYLGTGRDSLGLTNDFWEYDPTGNTWAQKTNFPGAPREFACGFGIGTNGYLGTGQVAGAPDWEFYEYNPISDAWTQKANYNGTSGVSAATCFANDNFGFIGLGWRPSGYTNQFMKYNPTSNTWSAIANFPGSPRSGAFGYGYCNKGYVGLGYDGLLPQDSWAYNISTNTWEQLAAFPTSGRSRAVAFPLAAKGFIGTGSNLNPPYMNDLWELTMPGAAPLISGTTSFCQGSCGTLVCSPGSNYMWSAGQTSQSIQVCVPGVYTVTVTDNCGLTGTTTVVVSVYPLPTPVISCPFPFLYSGVDSVLLNALGGYSSYLWMMNGQTVGYTSAIYATTPGIYTCIVTNSNGCSGVSAPLQVKNVIIRNPPTRPGNPVRVSNADDKKFEVFPNPAPGGFLIQLNESRKTPISISIYSSNGKLTHRQLVEPEASQLEIDNLDQGIYYIVLESEQERDVERILVIGR